MGTSSQLFRCSGYAFIIYFSKRLVASEELPSFRSEASILARPVAYSPILQALQQPWAFPPPSGQCT